jgi:hypothetical protein
MNDAFKVLVLLIVLVLCWFSTGEAQDKIIFLLKGSNTPYDGFFFPTQNYKEALIQHEELNICVKRREREQKLFEAQLKIHEKKCNEQITVEKEKRETMRAPCLDTSKKETDVPYYKRPWVIGVMSVIAIGIVVTAGN